MALSKEVIEQAKSTAEYIKKSAATFDSFCKAYNAFVPKLAEASKKGDEPMMRLYLPRVQPLEAKLDDLINTYDGAETLVGELSGNDEYAGDPKRFAALEKLTEDVSKKQQRLTEMLKQLKDLLPKAQDGLKAAAGSADELLRDVARMQDQVNDLKKRMQEVETDIDKLGGQAEKAAGAGKGKELTDARVKLIDHSKWAQLIKPMKAKIAKYRAEHATLTKESKAELTWMVDDLDLMLEIEKKRDDKVKELMKLKAAKNEGAEGGDKDGNGRGMNKVDLVKALKATGLPDAAKAKLKEVLQAPKETWEKALDLLAKKHGVQTKGKDMTKALEKEKAVAPA